MPLFLYFAIYIANYFVLTGAFIVTSSLGPISDDKESRADDFDFASSFDIDGFFQDKEFITRARVLGAAVFVADGIFDTY